MRSFLPLALVAVLLLGGCAAKPGPTAQERPGDVVHIRGDEGDPAEAGEIVGRVLDDEFRVLEAVSVRIQGLEARTKTTQDGIFYFASVPPRAYQLSFEKFGYAAGNKSVLVQPRTRAVVEIVLIQVASEQAYVDDGFVFRGRINCSVRANASGQNTNPECVPANAENDNLRQRMFDIQPGITYLLVEVDWRPTVGTVNDRLTLALRPIEIESWRQVQGARPIRALVTPADFADITKKFEKDYPRSGGQLQLFMFPGEAVSQGGYAVGTTIQQDFTIYATAWYRMEHDPSFSRLPKD